MNRVLVIGCAGAGKSTFCRRLNEIIKKEVIYLDQYYWKPNWKETASSEWQKLVTSLASKAEWIMDGNYSNTFNIRIIKADTIIFLDFPTWKCLWRVIRRTLKYYGQVRPDMPEGCRERFDWQFCHYILTFNIRRRKKILELLDSLHDHKRIVILKNDPQVHLFLQSLIDQ